MKRIPRECDHYDKHESSNPSAEAMVLSLRAMGYDLSTAIADLIDNSISANATDIHVDFSWNSGTPWILISDNGDGMSESELKSDETGFTESK